MTLASLRLSLRLLTPRRRILDQSLSPLRNSYQSPWFLGSLIQHPSNSPVTTTQIHSSSFSQLSQTPSSKLPRSKKRKRAQAATNSALPVPTRVTRSRAAVDKNAAAMNDGALHNEDGGVPSDPNLAFHGGYVESMNGQGMDAMQGMNGESIARDNPPSLYHGTGINPWTFPQYTNTQGDPLQAPDAERITPKNPSFLHYGAAFGPRSFLQDDAAQGNQMPQPGQPSWDYPSMGDSPQRHSAPSIHPPTTLIQHPTAFNASSVPLWKSMNSRSPVMMASMPHINPRFVNPAQGMLPISPFHPMGHVQPMTTEVRHLPFSKKYTRWGEKQEVEPAEEPIPTITYMEQAFQEPQRCSEPRPLLVILDLNGTLIHRTNRKRSQFVPREGLKLFLEKLFEKYSVMIWSSAKPETVDAICKKIFSFSQRRALLGEWGRDKLGLTPLQYNNKCQVYKELVQVWTAPEVQAQYPDDFLRGNFVAHEQRLKQAAVEDTVASSVRWDQSNTILIDDSREKAKGEPFNILDIPQFTNNYAHDESRLFAKVLGALDLLSSHTDVSAAIRALREVADDQCLKHGIVDLKVVKPDVDLCKALPVGRRTIFGKEWKKWLKKHTAEEKAAVEKRIRDQCKDLGSPDNLEKAVKTEMNYLRIEQNARTKDEWLALFPLPPRSDNPLEENNIMPGITSATTPAALQSPSRGRKR